MQFINEIKKELNKKGAKVSTAESCTAGYVSKMLTSVAGSSEYFQGSIVAYSNEVKINVLGVEKSLIDIHTEVSEPVAYRMAERVKKIMGTEYSIATTGYADINGFGTEENPAGTIYVSLSTPEGTFVERLELKDSRERNIYFASIHGLEMLARHIKNR